MAQNKGCLRILLVDPDPQGSCAAWWQAREQATPTLEATDLGKLAAVLDTARGSSIDLVIIDTRASVEADVVQVAALSNYLLAPARPAIMDLRAILGTLDILKGGRHRPA